jgi:hypothetical protein
LRKLDEGKHNTPEQVRGYLDDALAIVAELEPPGDLRALAFGKAIDLLAAKQIVFEQPQVFPVDLGDLKGGLG